MAASIFCHGVPSGLSLTAKLFPDGSDTAAATGLTVTEMTNRKTTYVFNTTVTGLHLIQLLSGSNVVWVGWTPLNLASDGNFESCDSRLEAMKTGRLQFDVDDNVLAAGVGGGTTEDDGPYTLEVTVTDGTDPLQNVWVRATDGTHNYRKKTNVSGVVEFYLNGASYTVTAAKPGHQQDTPLVVAVSDDEAVEIELSTVSLPASDPGFITGYGTAYSEINEVQQDVEVYCQLTVEPPGRGLLLDKAIRSTTSNVNGVYAFKNLAPGATYAVWRGSTEKSKSVTIPLSQIEDYALPNFSGVD